MFNRYQRTEEIMWLFVGVIVNVLILEVWCESNASLLPKVKIPQGVIVGTNHNGFYEFHGIPYADSTSGGNRFKSPSPPPIFKEEFTADRKDIKCPRALKVGYEGTEDCLVVNVMSPTLNTTARLPVMVWVKGKELDRAYIPEFSFSRFMDRNVIVVSLNYRESILGFLCLGTEIAPGNAGLKDIIAGLKWIQENIELFGGDPNNVSLFGHGSGGAAVDLITMSPMAKGLVHKVIAQSGNALSPWAVTRDNLKYAKKVAAALGHKIEDIQTLSEIIKRTNLVALMAVINELELTDNSLAFAPCIENESLNNVQPLLSKSPYEIIKNGEQLKIPFMTGFVDVEGTIRAEEALEDQWLEKMEESFVDFVQPDINTVNDEEKSEVVESIKRFYFGTKPIDISRIDEYLSYHGDTMILVSSIREASLRAASTDSPVYLYQFSFKGSLGQMFITPLHINRTGHNEELAYLFYDEKNTITERADYLVAANLLERWTNFAKSGLPVSDLVNTQWHPYSADNKYFLRFLDINEITNESNTITDIELTNPHFNTITFWNSIYEKYFNDAHSRWSFDEEDDLEENGSGDNTEDKDCDEEVEDCGNSATSNVAYTFTIILLFATINKFHNLQILS